MNRNLPLFAAALLVAAGLSCSGNGTGFYDPTLSNDGFKGITYTTSSPEPSGPVDPDDWNSSGVWDSRYPLQACGSPSAGPERQNARAIPSDVSPSPPPPNTFILPAYPNPFNGGVSLTFALAQDAKVYGAIINDRYELVVNLICGSYEEGYYLVIWNGKGEFGRAIPSDIYRFILLVTDSTGTPVFASHGDLWLKN